MSEADHDAQELARYLDAPALLLTSQDADTSQVEMSVEAVSKCVPLPAADATVAQRELTILAGHLEEVNHQLALEKKMGDAAMSISRLNESSPPQSKRLSRFFDKNKRNSRQADEEARISHERTKRLELAQKELTIRKLELENRLLRHHASVLSRALSGEPLNPVRPLSFNPSAIELNMELENAGSSSRRRSLVLPPLPSSSLPSSFTDGDANSELDSLARRVAQAWPSTTPNPNKAVYVATAFENLLREHMVKEQQIEALQAQAKQAEQRVAYLGSQLNSPKETSPETARKTAELTQLRGEVESERRRIHDLRTRCDAQRSELSRVTAELEEMTRLAVALETQRRDYDSVISQLENQVESLSSARAEQLASNLNATAPSILCKEFRKVVRELNDEHLQAEKELRAKKLQANGVDFRPSSGSDAASTTAVSEENGEIVHSPRSPRSRRESSSSQKSLYAQRRASYIQKPPSLPPMRRPPQLPSSPQPKASPQSGFQFEDS